jgi:hypothetical protein
MRKLIGILLLFGLFSFAAAAQEYPKAEVFGGYQYTNLDGTSLNGWNAALSGNLNHWFGVTGDFGAAYKSVSGASFSNYTYMFGPTLASRRGEALTPFVHALFGGFHSSASFAGFSGTGNGFAMGIGGGLDMKVTPRIVLRAGQFDWMSFRANGASSNNNFRYSGGIVFRFK